VSAASAEVSAAVDERRSIHIAIAQLHGFAPKLSGNAKGIDCSPERAAIVAYAFHAFLKMLGLFAPHLADTLWRELTESSESLFHQPWVIDVQPEVGNRAEVEIPLQINGNLIQVMSVPTAADDATLREQVLAAPSERLAARLKTTSLRRVVIVRNEDGTPRLINLVLA
jgi:leucyl-tRNA synthetase